MKRQKIKRYRFSVTQNTRRRRAETPLKAVGVVLVCLCLLTGAAFGAYKAIQSKTTGLARRRTASLLYLADYRHPCAGACMRSTISSTIFRQQQLF